MGIGAELKKRIEKQQKRIAEIEGQMYTLQLQHEKESAYLQALLDTVKMLPPDEQESTDAESAIAMRAGSNAAQARDVLRKAGKAMHVNEILRAMGKEPNKKDRLSLSGALALYVRKEQVFTRPEPNVFGLREWAGKPVIVPAKNVGDEQLSGTDQKTGTVPAEGKFPLRPVSLHRPLN